MHCPLACAGAAPLQMPLPLLNFWLPVISVCSAGRMPSEPASFAKMKAALGVQLAAALSAACGAKVTATEEALEVLWQGFAFKLLLYLDRWA
jgi:U3 small nucleolar RNA-associated protein 22